jgi:hypothetical protein
LSLSLLTPTAVQSGVIAGCGGWSYRQNPLRQRPRPRPRSSLPRSRRTTPQKSAPSSSIPITPAAASALSSSTTASSKPNFAHFTRFEMGSTLTGVPLYKLRGYVPCETINVPLPNGEVLSISSHDEMN